MIRDQLVALGRLRELFEQVEPQLIRYPAIDAGSLHERVMEITAEQS